MTTPTTAAAAQTNEPQLTPDQQAQNLWNEEVERRANPDAAPATEAPPTDGSAEVPLTEEQPEKFELPDDLKAQLAQVGNLQVLVQKLQHQVDSSNGRLGAMQRELTAARQAASISPGQAPNQQTIAHAAKSPEKWKKLKEEFPEWGEAVEDLVSANLPGQTQAPVVDFDPLREEFRQVLVGLSGSLGRAIEEAKVFGAHRDWKQVLQTKELNEWYAAQPDSVKVLFASDNGEDAIRALDMFKQHRQQQKDSSRNVEQERAARLAAAASAPRKGSAPPPKGEHELTADEMWAQEVRAGAERRKAQGR